MKLDGWLLLLLSIILLALLVYLSYQSFLDFQRRVVHHPFCQLLWNPGDEGLAFEDVKITDPDHYRASLHGWWVPHQPHYLTKAGRIASVNSTKTVVLYCHGNYGNISHYPHIVHLCQFLGYDLLTFDYNGYGQSKGPLKEDLLCQDGLWAYRYLKQRGYQPNQIIIWGESLGGAVATYIASTCRCQQLVLLSTFSGLDQVLSFQPNSQMSILSCVLPALINVLPVRRWLRRVKVPVTLMHSPTDEIIPYHCALVNRQVSQDNIYFLTIAGQHATPSFTDDQLAFLLRRITGRSYDQDSVKLLNQRLSQLAAERRRV